MPLNRFPMGNNDIFTSACPHCRQALTIAISSIGQNVECPLCGNIFTGSLDKPCREPNAAFINNEGASKSRLSHLPVYSGVALVTVVLLIFGFILYTAQSRHKGDENGSRQYGQPVDQRLSDAELQRQVEEMWRRNAPQLPRSSGSYTHPTSQYVPPQYKEAYRRAEAAKQSQQRNR